MQMFHVHTLPEMGDRSVPLLTLSALFQDILSFMPLLTTIDEYRSTVTSITLYAQAGLASADAECQEAMLRAIFDLCLTVDETVRGVLSPFLDPEESF